MGMALEELKENEKPVQVNGIDLLIEESVRPFVASKTVDYVKEPRGEGFIITGDSDSC